MWVETQVLGKECTSRQELALRVMLPNSKSAPLASLESPETKMEFA